VRAAQPFNDNAVDALASSGALAESLSDLRDRTMTVPRVATNNQRRGIQFSGPRIAAALALAACLAIAFVGVASLREGDSSGRAWAAAEIAFAKRTPQLLLTAPGWHITHVAQYDAGNNAGEVNYELAHSQNQAGIFWVPRKWHKEKVRGRASDASEIRRVTVRGIPAKVFYINSKDVGGPNVTTYSALWIEGKHSLRFQAGLQGTATKRQRAKFLSLLAAVKPVQTDVWLSAMPEGVLLPSQLPAAVQKLLVGVPQPEGFSIEPTLKNLDISEKDTLRFEVLAAVECVWISDWLTARRHGDKARMRQIAAEASQYKHWPIPDYVDSLSRGGAQHLDYGMTRDVVHDYKMGLGCPGVKYPG
jgi:uncharacterized membrane protein